MDVLAVRIVFRGVIAEKPQVDEVGRGRQEFEWRQIAFVERTGIGPDPAHPGFLEKMNVLRPMPTGMAKFDGEPEVARELREESAEERATGRRREGRWQLNEDDVQF